MKVLTRSYLAEHFFQCLIPMLGHFSQISSSCPVWVTSFRKSRLCECHVCKQEDGNRIYSDSSFWCLQESHKYRMESTVVHTLFCPKALKNVKRLWMSSTELYHVLLLYNSDDILQCVLVIFGSLVGCISFLLKGLVFEISSEYCWFWWVICRVLFFFNIQLVVVLTSLSIPLSAAYGPALLEHALKEVGLHPNAKLGKDFTAEAATFTKLCAMVSCAEAVVTELREREEPVGFVTFRTEETAPVEGAEEGSFEQWVVVFVVFEKCDWNMNISRWSQRLFKIEDWLKIMSYAWKRKWFPSTQLES